MVNKFVLHRVTKKVSTICAAVNKTWTHVKEKKTLTNK